MTNWNYWFLLIILTYSTFYFMYFKSLLISYLHISMIFLIRFYLLWLCEFNWFRSFLYIYLQLLILVMILWFWSSWICCCLCRSMSWCSMWLNSTCTICTIDDLYLFNWSICYYKLVLLFWIDCNYRSIWLFIAVTFLMQFYLTFLMDDICAYYKLGLLVWSVKCSSMHSGHNGIRHCMDKHILVYCSSCLVQK